MMPVLFTLGDFPVPTYLVIVAAAITMAVLLIRYYEIPRLKAMGRCPPAIIKYNGEALLIAVIFTVIGARLGYVVTNWHLYSDNLINILALLRGGFAYHGALILVPPAVALHAAIRRIPVGILLNLAIPYVALAYGVGRLACFFNGCCYGKVTEMPWGLVCPAVDSLPRHSTQLYAAAASLVIFLVLLDMNRRKVLGAANTGGVTFAWFLILHGSYRFGVEFFRAGEVYLAHLTLAQVVSLMIILTGTGFLLSRRKMRGGDCDD